MSTSIKFLNARSLKTVNRTQNKMLMFKSVLEIDKPDIMGVVETWFDDNVGEHEYEDKNYCFYRKDRRGRGGGLLLAINKQIHSSRMTMLESANDEFNEILVCDVRLNNCNWAVILFYRPPNSNINFNHNLRYVLDKVCKAGYKNLLLVGDSNTPEIDWYDMTSNNNLEYDLCELFDDYKLSQLNTHSSRRGSVNILDIILTNKPSLFSEVTCGESMIKSDHLELNCMINVYKDTHVKDNAVNRVVYNFKDVNWEEIEYYVSQLNLEDTVNECNDVNEAW